MKNLLILLLLISPLFAQNIDATRLGGLYFSGSLEKPGPNGSNIPLSIEKQSRLHITKEEKLTANKNWSMSFSFCLRENESSGALFTVLSSSSSLSFNYIQDKSNKNACFSLLINGEKTTVSFDLNKYNIYDGNWFDLKLSVDVTTGTASVKLRGLTKVVKSNAIKKSGKPDIIFGRMIPLNNCLAMIIKDLQIEIDGKLRHRWLFTEMSGNITYDSEGSLDIETENCDWLINKHFYWEPTSVGEAVSNSDYSKKPLTPEHLVFTSDKVSKYNLRKKIFTSILFEPDKNRFISNPSLSVNDSLTGLQNGYPDEPGILNIRTGKWLKTISKNTPDGHYYGGVTILDPNSLDVYLYGGYGWYTFKNLLLKFNNTTQKWDTCKTIGEKPIPTVSHQLLKGAKPDEFFIFGGLGVESGKQEDGQHPVWEMHKLDLRDLAWKKVWEWQPTKKIISYYGATWTNSNMNEFYTIAINFDIKNSIQRLVKLNLKDSSILFVGNTLPSIRKDMEIYSLHVDNETGLVYFIDNKLREIDSTPIVYSIRTPILSESEYIELLENSKPHKNASLNTLFKYTMLCAVIISLPIGFVVLYKKRNKKRTQEAATILRAANYNVKSNYITLFGGLSIIDENGTVIKEGFTTKLTELFSLIFLYSTIDPLRGITYARLDNLIWHDLPPENLKNNRNVAFTRLRAILKNKSGFSLITDQDSVRIELPKGMTNELGLFYKITLNNIDPLNNRRTSKFFTIISRGEFLYGIKSEWAHEVREEVISKIIKVSNELMNYYFQTGEYQKCLSTTEAVANHVFLSEEVLKNKINALIKLDRYPEAEESFKNFCEGYKERYKEEYGYDFDEFLSL